MYRFSDHLLSFRPLNLPKRCRTSQLASAVSAIISCIELRACREQLSGCEAPPVRIGRGTHLSTPNVRCITQSLRKAGSGAAYISYRVCLPSRSRRLSKTPTIDVESSMPRLKLGSPHLIARRRLVLKALSEVRRQMDAKNHGVHPCFSDQ